MLVGVILACEVAFWVFLFGGLAARYLLRRPALGAALLVCAPLVDLVTLGAGVLDLRGGGTAGFAHVLAAVYLGISVGFGHQLVRWADVRFAHRFAGGPAPAPRPRHGAAHAAQQRSSWLRHLAAWAVGTSLMSAAVLLVADPQRTEVFTSAAILWTAVLVADGVFSLSYSLLPRKAQIPRGSATSTREPVSAQR